MAIRLTEKSRALVELPMLLFLRIADADGKLTAREMARFDALLEKTQWCRSTLLKQAMVNARAEKAALWTQYAAGAFRTSIDRAAADLDTVLGTAPAGERGELERDLLHFCGEILKAARRAAGFAGDPLAAAENASLHELITRPSARDRTPRQPRRRRRIQRQPTRPLARLLDGFASEMIWRQGKLPLRCVHIVQENHNVKTFYFVAEPPKLFIYRPGQFVTLELRLDGKVLRRSYTISGSPSRPHALLLTVKRLDDGLASRWLHESLQVGDRIFADGPKGKFICTGDESGPYLFISGGSGITPLMAMSRWLHDTAPDTDICFLHFAQSPKDFIFERELRLMESHRATFRCVLVCTSDVIDWTGPRGRISAQSLTALVPDFMARRVFLCGPVPFMETAREILE